MKKYLLHIVSVIVTLVLPGCVDEIELPDDYIGPGEARVSANIEYEPSAAALSQGRSDGDALNEINTLSVVIYKLNGELLKIYNTADLKLTHSINVDKPSDYGDLPAAEDTTARVSFSLPEALPFGRYYMYAVVNLGTDVTSEMAADQETLRNQPVTWQFDDVKKNAQMFGYFTNADQNTSIGYQAPIITVNKPNTEIHSWVRRLASKVTIAYDGKGLHENVFVYIHKATIKQIPLTCRLGVSNKPESFDDISKDNMDDAQQVIDYVSSTAAADADAKATNSNLLGLMVANGTGILGSDHSKTADALFFYENMQGDFKDNPNREWFNKVQNPDSVGPNVTEGMPDYKDNVPYGTYVEVEGYYVSKNAQHITEGSIKYRFMLGQNTTYNYDAIRNHHYKLTLCFRGWANQPDWHIVYEEEDPDMFAPPVYVPYLYNESVNYPIKFNGKLIHLTAEIIENNWGPSDLSKPDGVPDEELGTADFDTKVLGFAWNKTVYMNEKAYTLPCPEVKGSGTPANDYKNNFLYGRHKSPYFHLDDNGMEDKTKPYYVTPVWVGFLRLQQPENLEGKDLPATIFANGGMYSNAVTIKGMKDYYEGKGGATISGQTFDCQTNLGYREFKKEDLTDGNHGSGRNSYSVSQVEEDGVLMTTLTLKLWTQPKTMGYISGFSGNNPYENYERRAVIRFNATFEVTVDGHTEQKTIVKDVDVTQSPRIVNPKGVWRRYNTPNKTFRVKLLHRKEAASSNFSDLVSVGEWSASIKIGDKTFISLTPGANASGGGTSITGKTGSPIDFTINFNGDLQRTESKCAVVEVLYHGNTCVHRIFVRQGYNQPITVMGDAKWSSYNVFSFDKNTAFGLSESDNKLASAVMTVNPLAFGTLFKRGNYAEGVLIKGMGNPGMGPLEAPGADTPMDLSNGTSKPWKDIYGIARDTCYNITGDHNSGVNPYGKTTTKIENVEYDVSTWKWAQLEAEVAGEKRIYRLPTTEDFQALDKGGYGVGVLYGDGATSPAYNTADAFGFYDTDNTTISNAHGMRGFFCYNPDNGNQIFFPIGSTGLGRRNMQNLPKNKTWHDYQGTLRYSSQDVYLDQQNNTVNQFRPIPYNMKNAPGSIYWTNSGGAKPGWDMNYFDLNFNPYDFAMSVGPYGDAVPIKPILVKVESTSSAPRK